MFKLLNFRVVLCLILQLLTIGSHVAAAITNDVQLQSVLETNPLNGYKITGETDESSFGRELSNVGDVNGDGVDDLIILSPTDGKVHVLYGNTSSQPDFKITDDFAGFTIITDTYFGGAALPFSSVAGVGDFNNDSLNDIAIGIPSYGESASGAVYVIYGQSSRTNTIVSLNILDLTDGFRIIGANAGDNCGYQVRAAGDINNDEIDDLIIGCNAHSVSLPGQSMEMVGKVYVIYGTSSIGDLHLLNFNSTHGFSIIGRDSHARFGTGVAGVGDVNGDGIDDVAITTAPDGAATPAALEQNIALCIIYGNESTFGHTDISLDQSLDAQRGAIYIGNDGIYSVSPAGDVNNDGHADVILGVRQGSPLGRAGAGLAYVLLGGPLTTRDTPVVIYLSEVQNIPEMGYVLFGAHAGDTFAALSMSASGDINHDGYPDIIIAAPTADVVRNGATLLSVGITYVLYGGPNGTSIDMRNFTTGAAGMKILGANAGDRSGRGISASGDFNGDGFVDVVISAVQLGVVSGDDAGPGVVYVLYGRANPTAAPSAVPSAVPSRVPNAAPSRKPSYVPTMQPTTPTLPPVVTIHKDVLLSSLLDGTGGTTGLIFHGPMEGSNFGSAVSSGDVNGDGDVDLFVGAPAFEAGCGAVYVILSRVGFPYLTNLASLLSSVSNGFMVIGSPSEGLGISVSYCDDVNGDGLGDMIVGTTGSGKAYVIYGVKVHARSVLHASALTSTDGFTIQTPKVGNVVVSGAGDVNGDGLGDVIVGSSANNTAWVIFGTRDSRQTVWVDRSSFGGSDGFRMVGPTSGYKPPAFGFSVSRAGDVNNDGFADVIVGSSGGMMGTAWHRACVVFGHNSSTPFSNVLLSSTGAPLAGGFALTGKSSNYLVSSAGDFNNDGYDDVIVSDYRANPSVGSSYLVGMCFVIFGHSDVAPFETVNLDALAASAGFKILSATSDAQVGIAVSAAGDINGDGINDLLVGAILSSAGPAGTVYVIFGHNVDSPFPDLKLDNFYASTRGYRVFGTQGLDLVGTVVSAAGDLNHDGLGDFLIGAPGASGFNGAGSGSAYVLYGTTPTAAPSSAPTTLPTYTSTLSPTASPTIPPIATVYGDFNLSRDGTNTALGFRISGTNVSLLGSAVAYGDVNGDGASDVLLSAPSASYENRSYCGTVVVLFGQGSTGLSANIDITTLTPDVGVVIYGDEMQRVGSVVSVLGDVNGDGIADVLVGSPNIDHINGTVFVIYGRLNWTDVDLSLPLATAEPPSGFQIFAVQESDGWSHVSASKAGDVNGDGLADFVISNPTLGGQSHVIFGTVAGGNVFLADFTTGVQGYKIIGAAGLRLGILSSDIGDFNGDGFGDIIISSICALSQISLVPGAMVLYGHSNQPPFEDVEWTNPELRPSKGFFIPGPRGPANFFRVGRAGDFNGDGYDDVVIGLPSVPTSSAGVSLLTAGRTIVLFGHNRSFQPSAVNFYVLNATTTPGFAISGGISQDYSGASVASAGDVNNDGYDDILVGARTYSVANTGLVYVLFGHSADLPFPDIRLGSFYAETRGFRILGGGLGGALGLVVSSAGDLNQDGFADIVVTVSAADTLGRVNNGAAYVIYGKQETPTAQPTVVPSVVPSFVPTATPTLPPVNTVFGDYPLGQLYGDAQSTGFAIYGTAGAQLGLAVGTGDFNNDSYPDLLVSSPYLSERAGQVFVLFGTEAGFPPENIDLANFTAEQGVLFVGPSPLAYLGMTLSNAGDINNDGADDILVGCPGVQNYDGLVFVIYGGPSLKSRVLNHSEELPGDVGYRILGALRKNVRLGYVAEPIGDFNHDGYDDIAISAGYLPYKGAQSAGMVMVVYGSGLTADVNVSSVTTGARGFRVFGTADSQLGNSLDCVDFNGDGLSDLLISVVTTSASTNAGLVIFSRSNADIIHEDIELNSTLPSSMGVRFVSSRVARYMLKNAGDMNGDGYGDIIVSRAVRGTVTIASAQVIFGRADAAALGTVNLDSYFTSPVLGFNIIVGTIGIRAMGSAGDFNNDGYADVMLSLTTVRGSPGQVYIIFGHSNATEFTQVDISQFYETTRGVRLLAGAADDFTGYFLRGLGDINGDGIDDVAVTAPSADVYGRVNTGTIYVVYGSQETPTAAPTAFPTIAPSVIPSTLPSAIPSVSPSNAPTDKPTFDPTFDPTSDPTWSPTEEPSVPPTVNPTLTPTLTPTIKPSFVPTATPTFNPTQKPTSAEPTMLPTKAPVIQMSNTPTGYPTDAPTVEPTDKPTTQQPSSPPTPAPSVGPTVSPSADPTVNPTAGPTTDPTADPTAVLTVSPTVGPTVPPSADPSFGPTVSPTTDPTAAPSTAPTFIPSVHPTGEPTMDPTNSPSVAPSMAPTEDPTVDPTAVPTQEPTVLPSSPPTVQPTHKPSIDPTAVPSASPTLLPTVVPSVGPTVTPSATPTDAPTTDPSVAPSTGPSVKPTRKPSAAPTVSPTAGPSILPTVVPGNTQAPSRFPTQLPTVSTADLWRGELQELLQVVAAGKSPEVAHSVAYSEVVVATAVPPNLYGSCASWRTLLQGEISVSNALYRPLALTLAAQQSLSGADAPALVTCDDTTAAHTILQALVSSSSETQSVTCSEQKWVVRTCSAGTATALCVNCDDPCVPSLHCASTSISGGSNPWVVAPCAATTTVCTGTSSLASAARVLSVSYKELQPTPTIVSQTYSAAKTSVTVQTTLNTVGSVSCAAFAVNAQSGEASVPTSVSQILMQNFAASTNAANTSVVIVNGLQAANQYRIYCLAASPLGAQQTIAQAVAKSFVVSTACCIDVSVRATSNAIKTGTMTSNFLTVTVAARPAHSVSLTVSLHSVSTGAVATVGSFFPAVFTLSALQQAVGSTNFQSSASVFTASLPSLPTGDYFYNVTLSGESAYQYAVSYVSPTTALTVLSASEPLPAPGLVSALFANDGSHVVISFDAKSDKGGVATEFSCAQLFNFACAEKSTCVWTSTNQVDAYVSNNAGCAAVDSSVSLASTAAIRAECSGSNCDDLASSPIASTSVSVLIQSPAAAIAPTVTLSAPNSVGECDSLTLDMSSSSGSGGRPWFSRTISVSSLAPVEVITALQQLLDTSDRNSALVNIPVSYISKGFVYSFTVKLCNFLGQCGQSTKRVLAQSSTIPTVSLPGASLRTVKRSASLSISSDAYFVPCGGSATRAGLTYSWSLAVNGVQDLSFTSASRDPSTLLIAANTLTVNTMYDVTLTVTIASTLRSASATVQVFVAPSHIMPVIALGLSRTVRVDQTVTLDASGSYDEDQVGLTASAAGVTFAWSCVQVAPVLADTCSNMLSVASSGDGGKFVATAGSNSAGAVVKVTLDLLDASQSRTARSVVTVTVLPSLSPVVTATSNVADTGVLNSNRELQLTGEATFPVGYNGSVTWSVDDTSAFSLFDSAKSPLVTLIGSSGTAQSIYLVVAANSLPDRSTLTFSLTARLNAAGGTSAVVSVPVKVNAPPILGLFSVSPSNGTEIVDKFTFVASQWVDSDLPLQYLFAYVASSGVEVTLRSKKEATYSSLALTAGLDSDGYAVNCVMHVFDALSAESTRTHTVNVFPEERDAAALAGLIEASLAEGEDSVDGKKQSAALGSYLLNQVNCTAAPNCTALNRQHCFRTPNTCGACLSASYVGTAGDSNQACVMAADLTLRRLSRSNAMENSHCSKSSDCGPFETCSSAGVCARELMQCKGNCSYPQGTCRFVDADSGDAVAVCYVGDTSCRATCDCTVEFAGSETCSMGAGQLLERQRLRLQLVQSIAGLIASEDAELAAVEGWISTLLQVAQVPDELSEDAALLLLSTADSIIATAAQLGVSADIVMSLLTAVDSAVQASNDRSARRRRVLTDIASSSATRRLLQTSNEQNSTLSHSESTLAQFRAFLQSSLLPNQNAVELVLPQFRVKTQVLAGSALATDDAKISMDLPLSALEVANGQSSSSISIPADSTGDSSAVYISLSSLRSEPFNRQLGLSGYDQVFSNPLTVDLAGSSCSGPQCRFEMTLQTAATLSAAVDQETAVESYNTTCTAGVVTPTEVTCADGTVIPVLCDGTDSVVVSSCPVVTYSPVCNALVGASGPTASGCSVVSDTATSITCSCPINTAANGRRLQTEESPDDEPEASVSVSYVGMLAQIKGNFVNTIISAQGLNASTLERGWSAMATVGALAVAILFAFYWSHQADADMEKVVPAGEKAKKLATMNPSQAKSDQRRIQSAKLKRTAKVVANRDIQIAEQALPSILSSQSLSKRVTVEVKQHHKWFGIVFHFSRDFPRVLRVASLATNVIIMLFIQSLTYSLTSGDDGSCATYSTRDTCLEERSAYATGASKCYWTESSGECAFVEPDDDIMVILFVAIFSAIVCTPFALLVDYIIIYVLSAPTKASSVSYLSLTPRGGAGSNRHRLRTASSDFVETASPTAPDSRLRTVSADVYEMTNAIMMGSSRRRTRNESMDIQANRMRTVSTNSEGMFEIVPGQINTQRSTMNIGDGDGGARGSVFGSFVMLRGNSTIDNGFQLSAQSDLRLLVDDISRYRDTLVEEERIEFDLLWGLDEHGCFKSDDELQSGLLHRLKRIVTCAGQSNAASSGSVSQRVLLDLRAVHENFAKEEALAAARSFDNRQKGRRLLFLFQRDLLPGVSGMILESKGQRDNISAPQVSREAKIAAWTFLGMTNVGMLFYILLFALSQTTHRQGAWALSFILWLVVEILLVSSATVVFTHILVPSLIMQDVKKIKMKLVESIRAFNHNVKNRTMYEEDAEQGENGGTSGGPFNAANYLFTSTRLAKKWPELREAQIISQFRTPWPKQSYMRESSVSKSYSRKYAALTRSASIVIIFFMTQMLQVPPGLQDMVVQMVATASIGYTILLHLNLYQIFPLLAFLPLLLVIVIVHFVMQSSKGSAQQAMNKLLATPPSPPASKAKGQEGSPRMQEIAPVGEILVKEDASPERTIWQHISNSFDAVDATESDEEEEGMFDPEELPSDNEDCDFDYGELHLPATPLGSPVLVHQAQPKGHVNRKQSVLMGVQVLRELESAVGREGKEEKEYTAPTSTTQRNGVLVRGTRIRADSSSGESICFSEDGYGDDDGEMGGNDEGNDVREEESAGDGMSEDDEYGSESDEEVELQTPTSAPVAAGAASTFSSIRMPSEPRSSLSSRVSAHTEAKGGDADEEQKRLAEERESFVSSETESDRDGSMSEDEEKESSFVLSEESESEKERTKVSGTKAGRVHLPSPVVLPRPIVDRTASAFDSSDKDFSVSSFSVDV